MIFSPDGMPSDIHTEALRHAAIVREFYDAYIQVGFTKAEAHEMTLTLVDALFK